MNHPAPESGALKAVLPKLVRGRVVIFDDYGWWGYSAQKIALDKVAPVFWSGNTRTADWPGFVN